MPIILGRGFLDMREANINLLEGKLTLRIGQENQEFKFFKLLKYPFYDESCSRIDAIDNVPHEK